MDAAKQRGCATVLPALKKQEIWRGATTLRIVSPGFWIPAVAATTALLIRSSVQTQRYSLGPRYLGEARSRLIPVLWFVDDSCSSNCISNRDEGANHRKSLIFARNRNRFALRAGNRRWPLQFRNRR